MKLVPLRGAGGVSRNGVVRLLYPAYLVCKHQLGAGSCFKLGNMGNRPDMIVLGLVFLLLGAVLGIGILWTLGVILLVVGCVLFILGRSGRRVGGRAHYW